VFGRICAAVNRRSFGVPPMLNKRRLTLASRVFVVSRPFDKLDM
jgi:hypothetical protein